jgi:hypothetical protein
MVGYRFRYKKNDIVMIDNVRLKILKTEPIASQIYRYPHYTCKIVGRGCTDVYSEKRMVKV